MSRFTKQCLMDGQGILDTKANVVLDKKESIQLLNLMDSRIKELEAKLSEIYDYASAEFDDEMEMSDALYNITCVC